jgi:hypothetical protein
MNSAQWRKIMANKLLIETEKEAAQRLADKSIRKGFKPEALHEYMDETGKILHWRIRLKNPISGEKWIRPMRYCEQNGYAIGEPEYPNGKPLYNLLQLSSNQNSSVIICEGESCVDALKKIGVVATTSGSADSASKTDWKPLSGRTIIIWPDNDEPGLRYSQTVGFELLKLGCTVKQIDIEKLNLCPKGDVVDWLSLNPQAGGQEIAALPTTDIANITIENNQKEQQNNDNLNEDKINKKSQASELTEFVKSRVELFHDKNSITYAKDLLTQETRRLEGRQFKDWLVSNFYESTQKSPRDQAVREALCTLSGLARHQGECHDVYIRVAQYKDDYFLDLGEPNKSRAIQISPGKWEIINDPPVRFLRPESLRPLPEPISNSDLSNLWEIINIPEDSKLLIIAWLCECLRIDTPFPLLEIIGEQGSAKSTTQFMLRQLIDPNACNLRAAPKTIEDIFVAAGVNWLVSYENISHLSAPIQDTFCVIATGGGFAKRKLYSDADESVIMVKRPIVLNGISAPVSAQDLIDRTISIEMPVILKREESTALRKIYNNNHAKFLGAVLDIFSGAIALLPIVQLPSAENRPRLIEFAKLGMAIAKVLGKPENDFLSQFNKSREESISRTIDASPVASTLIEWIENHPGKSVTMPTKNLFEAISFKKPTNTESWPRSAKGFADALRRAAPALRQLGIECRSLGKIGGSISWLIKRLEK